MSIKNKALALVAAGIVLAAGALGAAGYVSAQEGDPTPAAEERQRPLERFLEKVAANLGVSADQLRQAIKDAEIQTVDEALADGRITEEQAAKIKERIESGEGLGLRRVLERRHERQQQRHERIVRLRRGLLQSAASAIGITPQELKDALKQGETSIADVAAAHGLSVDDVKAKVLSDAEAKLDGAVANGRITQERADEALQRLTDEIDGILSKKR